MKTSSLAATETLKEEHRLIERLLRVLAQAASKVERGEEVSPTDFARALDFIRNFADRCHHGKEEDCLFPALEAHGLPRHAGPVGVMLAEHEEGRGYVRGLAQALEQWQKGDKSASRAVAKNARGYAALLANHIPKEDNILYPIGGEHPPRRGQEGAPGGLRRGGKAPGGGQAPRIYPPHRRAGEGTEGITPRNFRGSGVARRRPGSFSPGAGACPGHRRPPSPESTGSILRGDFPSLSPAPR